MSITDPKKLRSALGKFATGVTIVTTMSPDGKPVGVTANSFSSVSLNPPLVLWSLSKSAYSLEAFSESGHFAIHVLTQDQSALSNKFARSGENKFDDTDWRAGTLGSPVFPQYAVRFECKTRHQYDGGDHFIFVGEVISFDEQNLPPLVFHDGKYAGTTQLEKLANGAPNNQAITNKFVLRLLAESEFLTAPLASKKLSDWDLSGEEFILLAAVKLGGIKTLSALQKEMNELGFVFDDELINALVSKQKIRLLDQENDREIVLSQDAIAAILDISEQTTSPTQRRHLRIARADDRHIENRQHA